MAKTEPGATTGARTRRPRNSLNPDAIVEAAVRVTDRDGIGALTFEALGRELGSHPTAIYRHFRDKDELVRALVDRINAEAQLDGLPQTDDWQADLRRIAAAIHRAFLAHPAVAQLVPARTAAREHEFVTVEYIVSCMRRAGLPDEEAAACYRVFADFVLAYAGMDAALAALAPSTREAELLTWDVDYRRLPPERFPHAAATAEHFPRLDDPRNFALAVDLMIEAIAARATARRAAR
ncbi:TetR/AcrR family transcriptional regulator [Kineosporia sp. R_H_3]|uniref:TetR/AcrR family transcriptional regulator n=1 Tax=Kineosporia sp. R_H_3 TaxID=1961848 RepID=UPI000B4AA63D|nr:TetR/AcrR family transcriptional regulator [Kineosporia sp. R_H_3]